MSGELSSWSRRRLPIIAAAMGMAAPALVFLTCTANSLHLAKGWAIPAATDIAFALGVLALLGDRAPPSLKLFLTTVAIVDDMGAVAIIAVAYTSDLNIAALLAAGAAFGVMIALNRMGVKRLSPYLVGFAFLWYATLLSGVHATVAGVLAATTIPLGNAADAAAGDFGPLARLERAVHPWSAYIIVPLFGFANAGVALSGLTQIWAPLPMGIAAGLFLGKQVGVFASVWLSVRLGFAVRPQGTSWIQIYGVAVLCGVGFTMSLFIGVLAFPGEPALVEEAKIGTLAGSLMSGLVGFIILRFAPHTRSGSA